MDEGAEEGGRGRGTARAGFLLGRGRVKSGRRRERLARSDVVVGSGGGFIWVKAMEKGIRGDTNE